MATLHELVEEIGCSPEELIIGLYAMARAHPEESPFLILNAGCTTAELNVAEQRVGIKLPSLHRHILSLSNGGSLPYVNSIQYLAAALPRESEWTWLVEPPQSHADTFDRSAGLGPFRPVILGESLTLAGYTSRQAETLRFDDLVIFASGYDGEFFGYSRSQMDRVDYVAPDPIRSIAGTSFRDFLLRQPIGVQLAAAEFANQVRSFLQ